MTLALGSKYTVY